LVRGEEEERFMRGQAFVVATAMATALMGLVQPAAAQQYPTYHDAHVANAQCQQSQQNRTVGGALIGGIAGAVLGHNAAGGHGSRDEGTALGAVVGAIAGGAIGRGSAQCAPVQQGNYDPYNGQSYQQYPPQDQYGDDNGYYKGDDDLDGGPYQESGYYNNGNDNRDCRVESVVREDRYGRRYRDDVTMCRDDYGRWREER
jgi:hypothetical protein